MHPGHDVGLAKDFTLYALTYGYVRFRPSKQRRKRGGARVKRMRMYVDVEQPRDLDYRLLRELNPAFRYKPAPVERVPGDVL